MLLTRSAALIPSFLIATHTSRQVSLTTMLQGTMCLMPERALERRGWECTQKAMTEGGVRQSKDIMGIEEKGICSEQFSKGSRSVSSGGLRDLRILDGPFRVRAVKNFMVLKCYLPFAL